MEEEAMIGKKLIAIGGSAGSLDVIMKAVSERQRHERSHRDRASPEEYHRQHPGRGHPAGQLDRIVNGSRLGELLNSLEK